MFELTCVTGTVALVLFIGFLVLVSKRLTARDVAMGRLTALLGASTPDELTERRVNTAFEAMYGFEIIVQRLADRKGNPYYIVADDDTPAVERKLVAQALYHHFQTEIEEVVANSVLRAAQNEIAQLRSQNALMRDVLLEIAGMLQQHGLAWQDGHRFNIPGIGVRISKSGRIEFIDKPAPKA